jgi:hypothetical protein
MAMNLIGGEAKGPATVPVTLPRISLPPDDDREIEREAREAALRVSQQKIIRAGRDALQEIKKAERYESWIAIGQALKIGRDIAMRSTGANRPAGQTYCRAFGAWLRTHHFILEKSLRFATLQMVDHLPEIERWRETVGDKRRQTLTNPVSNLRAWRRETGLARNTRDALAKAEAAWHNFTRCMSALSPEQAAPLWRAVHEAARRWDKQIQIQRLDWAAEDIYYNCGGKELREMIEPLLSSLYPQPT